MKKIITLFIYLMFTGLLFANPVSKDAALQVAYNFYKHYSSNKSAISVKNVIENTYNSKTTFYTIEFGNGGFIMISADDAAVPVLGYSFENTYNENVNPAAQAWFYNYSKEIYSAIQSKADNTKNISLWEDIKNNVFPAATKGVGELLSSRWDQGTYYNGLCPSDVAAASTGGRVWSGCVATTMAQLMNYYKYPANGIGTYSYTHSKYGTQTANFGATTYDWNNMPAQLLSTSTSAQKTAVATLIYHCAVSVDMNFATDGSGATSSDAYAAFKKFFNYSPTIQLLSKSDYPDLETWRALLCIELDAGRPFYYSGSGSKGGHAWVCDGYDTSNPVNFHMNWGWSGSQNAFFAIGALNTSAGTWNDGNNIIIGIAKGNQNLICRFNNMENYHNYSAGDTVSISYTSISGTPNQVKLYLDNSLLTTFSTSTVNNYKLLTAGLTTSLHTLRLEASDGANTNSDEVSFAITAWKKQNSSFSVPQLIRGINIVNNNIAWVWLGSDANNVGSIQFTRTIDGGKTWVADTIRIKSTDGYGTGNISPIDGLNAWAAIWAPSGGGKIVKTTDGGVTWAAQTSALFAAPGGFPNFVHFFDANTGFCQGDPNILGTGTDKFFEIYTTSDGGTTWTRVAKSKIDGGKSALANEAGTVNMYDVKGDTIWFGTNAGRVFRSADKGQNWTASSTGNTGQTDVRFKNKNFGIASTLVNSAFVLSKTSDGGLTWTSLTPKGAWYGNSDYTYVPGTASTWVTVGYGSAVSYDDGQTFYALDDNIYSGVRFLSKTTGWAGGVNSSAVDGGIYKWQGSIDRPTLYSVTFNIKDAGNLPVSSANINFNNADLSTDATGKAIFQAFEMNYLQGYRVKKTSYSTVTNYLLVKKDTVLNIVLPPTFTVTFTVKSTDGTAISNAQVDFASQSKITSADGTIDFSGISIADMYTYKVYKSNFAIKYGSVQVKDKNVAVPLSLFGTTAIYEHFTGTLLIYPNPVRDIVNIQAETPVKYIKVMNITGQLVLYQKFDSNLVQVNLSSFENGIYLIEISDGKNSEIKKVLLTK